MTDQIIIAPELGDILMFNADALFSKVQHVSTERWIKGVSPKSFLPGNRSHTAFGAGIVCGEVCVFESKMKALIDPWSNVMYESHRIYRFNAPPEAIAQMMNGLFTKDNYQWYGFLRLPYFPYRKVVEHYLKIDVRRHRLMFPGGVICSQVFWLGADTMCQIMNWQDMHDYLDEWRGYNFHSSDTQSVIDAFPNHITLIDNYNLPT